MRGWDMDTHHRMGYERIPRGDEERRRLVSDLLAPVSGSDRDFLRFRSVHTGENLRSRMLVRAGNVTSSGDVEKIGLAATVRALDIATGLLYKT